MLDRTLLTKLGSADSEQEILGLLETQGLVSSSLRALEPVADLEHPYSRRILGQSEECEIMLARWTQNRECAPHNHGSSRGFVLFLSGRFRETHYRSTKAGLERTDTREIAAGTIVKVVPGEVHSCLALEAGLSLHVYFPPIEGMRVFDIENREMLKVAANAGAWVPQPESLVLSREHY